MVLLGSQIWINETRYEPCPKTRNEVVQLIVKVVSAEYMSNGVIVRLNKKTLSTRSETLPEDIPDGSEIEVMTLQYAVERLIRKMEHYGM